MTYSQIVSLESNWQSRIVTLLQPIDAQALQALRDVAGEGGDSFVAEAIESYLEDAPLRLKAISQAVAQADAVALRKSAHALRSLSATLGAIPVAQLSEALEAIGRAGTTAGASTLVEQIQAEYERLEVALQLEHPGRQVLVSPNCEKKTPLILIVDDEKTVRVVLRQAMEQEGYRIAEAENGKQCLELCQQLKPDIVLLDAIMPDIDGFTCCAQLTTQPGGPSVLMITTLNDKESVDQAFEVGATDYVTKPIHWPVLFMRVRRLLQTRWAMAQLRQRTQELVIANEALCNSEQAAIAQVEELEKLNRLKDEFLSTVSHELRTPVTNMKMALQMLTICLSKAVGFDATGAEHRKIKMYLEVLQDECKREICLLNDLLDLQRLDAGFEPLKLETICLETWLRQVAEPFQERARNQNQTFQLELLQILPPLVSNQFKLERILAELLNNACKYTPSGERITLKAFVQSSTIQLQVINSGVEIPKSELPRIFDKFYRVPTADPWKQGGTGLGLALVQKLVEHLGVRIWVESASKQTCFTVELPLNA